MGFLSNLKNSLTGNWADVSVSAPPTSRGESVALTVRIAVKDNAMEFEKVVVEVRCAEIVEIPNYRATGAQHAGASTPSAFSSQGGFAPQGGTSPSGGSVDVRTTESLFTQTVQVAGAQKLDAGSQHTFEGTVALPAHLPPSMRGRHARYEWHARASIDMRGNDPDSGWQPLEVR